MPHGSADTNVCMVIMSTLYTDLAKNCARLCWQNNGVKVCMLVYLMVIVKEPNPSKGKSCLNQEGV